ncbi:MAG: deoxyribose-phosphate aldolase [Coriobacteriia bacterium]|nr:deoxyribose-phosphate aldolase [Actinomycetota bacterium]MDZ4167701.1 deoxyribose-phosphate aldolase [Coriobacteriia bacterium]
MDRATLASAIDQTLLKPTVGYQAAAAWMEQSAGHGFATLCVSPFLVPLAAQRLSGGATRVCSVSGFPLGYANTESKAEESAHLVQLGCHEVDMVLNYAALLEGDDAFVLDDIAAVVRTVATASHGAAIVKVILETGYLDEAQIERACGLAVEAGAHFVKTSTGFGPRGASVEDVMAMRAVVGPDIGVKAAGGIRDLDTALAMFEAGASRIGTSSGIEILEAFDARG